MNARKIILLIVALVIAGGTMMMARSSMNGSTQRSPDGQIVKVEESSAVEVLVAARDLPAGTLLKEADLKWQAWPKNGATEIYAIKGQKVIGDYVGSVVRQGLRTGEPVLSGRVVRVNEQGFLSAVLMPGMRAITIPITPASGVAGFAFPGDRVDVIVTHKILRRAADGNSTNEHRVSETALADVRVLALDQKTDDQTKEAKVAQLATLEVSPQQAERLALVNELGTLSLVLRSMASDVASVPSPVTSAEGIDLRRETTEEGTYTLDSDVSQALPKPISRSGQLRRVQILRGKETSESIFDAQ